MKNILNMFKQKNKFNEPIDLVYTWVDGNDPEWQEEKLKWQKICGIESGDEINPCRFIDNEELRYSLRSVAKNAPWINHIYIITNGQVPKWLDTSHPKITIVKHEEIMPKDALPTFNSNAIETCLSNIPNLSEYFLYANDDFFINKPVRKNFFFDNNGKPILRLLAQCWTGEEIRNRHYQNNVFYSAKLIEKQYGKFFQYESNHNITPYKKSYYNECKNIFSNEFNKTCHAKFRQKESIQRSIISFYALAKNFAKGYFITDLYNYKDTCLINTTSPTKITTILEGKAPFLFCVNDNEYTNQDDRLQLKSVLNEKFPIKAEWEIQKDVELKPIYKDTNSINIVFCPDNKFIKYFSVALQSIIDNASAEDKYDIILFESDISLKNKKKVQKMLPQNFSVRYFDIKSFISENFINFKMQSKNNWSISMFYRIFIPFVMQSYNKVLYLDSDVCINHNIKELFQLNSKNYESCVVKDTSSQVMHIFRMQEMASYRKNVLKLKNLENYFNSGMILFNIQNIDIKSYTTRFLNTLSIPDLMYPDQDILNIIFENNSYFIHSKWNYLYGECEWGNHYLNLIDGEYKKEFLDARNNPFIIHYTSPRKPWHRPDAEYADIFWKYARKTPFYEEIIYENTKQRGFIRTDTLKNINLKRKIYFNYYRYKLLSYITFGETKKHYIFKRGVFKERVKDIRKYSKL